MFNFRGAFAPLQYVQVTEGFIGLIGNVLVCVTIMKTKALHDVTNYLLLHLAAVDAIVSLIGILDPTLATVFRQRLAFTTIVIPVSSTISTAISCLSFLKKQCFQIQS